MAKADLNINVSVAGSEKAEKQLEGVGKAARAAGDGAKKGGESFKSFGGSVGDVSEQMDKQLEQSVGRSFKGFDRLTSIMGQVTGAAALLTGGAALAGAAFGALGIELFKANKAAEEAKRQADELASSYKSLAGAIGDAFLASTLKQALEGSSLVADLARVEAARGDLVASGSRQSADLALTQQNLSKVQQELKLQRKFPEEFGKPAREAELQIAALTKRAKEQSKAVAETDAQFQSMGAEAQTAQARIDALRQTIKDTFELRTAVGPLDAGGATGGDKTPKRVSSVAPDRSEEDALLAQAEDFLARETNLARMAEQERQALATERQQRETIDRSTRIRLIADDDERQLELVRERHRAEMEAAEEAKADLIGLKRAQVGEIADIEKDATKKANKSRLDDVKKAIRTGQVINSALASGAKTFGLGKGAEMFAQGLQDAGDAATYGAKAFGHFAAQDYFGGAAYTTAAAMATAAAVKNFAGAATLGKSGGSAGGGGAITPVAAPQRSDVGTDGGGERTTVFNVQFSGRSFATRRELREDVADIVGDRGRGGRVVNG